jgi:hypothetical protein
MTTERTYGRSPLSAAQDAIAEAVARWTLNRWAHPKRPNRTPRKLKKAARKALARLNSTT